ncbi:hypothetical protein IP88_09985 [alpha proteobacterium AAP81b]|nr:hypothetical protein IP88_09985 [alpha proteobacterium AAP81b]
MRRAHYPADRNQVPAHISLFHQLPGSQLDAVKRRLKAVCGALPPPRADITGLKSLGQGVAARIVSPELVAVRDELAEGWAGLLIAQDRHGFAPHLTIQNKVTAAEARATLARLETGFTPIATRIVALALWRYLDGPWQPLGEIAFRGR